MNQLVFYKNWWDLAQLQTDGDLRLAFYDAIVDYAFEGKIPPEVGRDGLKEARAARFAYLTVQPVIDLSAKRAAAGAASGKSRQNKTTNTETNTPTNKRRTNGEQNANKRRTNREHADEQADGKKTNTVAKNRIEKNRIEENRNVDASASTTGGGGGRLPSREVFLSACESTLGVPRDFADGVYTELSMFEGEDASGVKIGSWRRYVKAAWNREQSARAAAASPSDDSPRHISEDNL